MVVCGASTGASLSKPRRPSPGRVGCGCVPQPGGGGLRGAGLPVVRGRPPERNAPELRSKDAAGGKVAALLIGPAGSYHR